MKKFLKRNSIREKNEDYIEIDVIAEKYKRKLTKVKGEDGNFIKEGKKYVKQYTDSYIGSYLVPTTFYKEGITLYSPAITMRDTVLKTRCTIYDKYSNKFYLVNHSKEELDKALIKEDKPHSVGFIVKPNK